MAPTGVLDRLRTYYKKDAERDLPAISPRSAAFLSIFFTLLYVLPFYLSATTRPSPSLSRDAPSVIRARIRTVTLSCVLSALMTGYVVLEYGKTTPLEALKLFGWWPIGLSEIACSFLLTAVLFLGPLFERGIAEGDWRDWIRGRRIAETLGGWIGWRNFVAGPATEELLFRSLLIPLHLLAKVPPKDIVFFTPLYFGIAHVHHFYEFKLTHPHTPIPPALFRSLFQFTYTTVFGWYAAFVFLRTGSLIAVILAHSFCNWCGLPRLWGRVEAGEPVGPPISHGKEDPVVPNAHVADDQLGVGWTVAYYVLLFTGAWAFYIGLWPLTESRMELTSFSSRKV